MDEDVADYFRLARAVGGQAMRSVALVQVQVDAVGIDGRAGRLDRTPLVLCLEHKELARRTQVGKDAVLQVDGVARVVEIWQ